MTGTFPSSLKELLDVLRRRVVLLAEESCRDKEPLSLQSSELRLGGLVRELHAETQRRASLSESLCLELHRWEGGRQDV